MRRSLCEVKESVMADWYDTTSKGKSCRIDLEQVVAVVATDHKGHVEVYLRGGHSLVVQGKIDELAPEHTGDVTSIPY